MALTQFMLPGESVLYESPGEVYYRRTAHALLITGERLVLYAVTGLFGPKEHVVARTLSGIRQLEYSEVGVLSKRGRLDVRSADETISLRGRPDAIRDVWQALQRHTLKTEIGVADEETTLVVPPAPLFGDTSQPPAQVEPLHTATPYRTQHPPRMRGVLAFVAVCLVALGAVTAVLLFVRQRPTAPTSEATMSAASTPTPPAPAPAPTAVHVRVMDETFSVEEGSHRAVKFTVPDGPAETRVAGGFRVTGGSYIDFYVMSETQYDRFATGGPPDVTSAIYREEQWNARVGERLPPGSYYLVFDNRDYGRQTVAAEFFVVIG